MGFDEGNNAEYAYSDSHLDGLRSGSAYIPTYAADSVIAVSREDSKTLYAIWEPMVYVTFVNNTAKDLNIDLSDTTASVISIVNEVTNEFDREKLTTMITVPANGGSVKIVLPKANTSTDSIVAKTTNTHLGYRLSVRGEFNHSAYGTSNPGDFAHIDETLSFTGELRTEPDVTHFENPEPDIYTIKKTDIDTINRYKPADPTKSNRIFIGWTNNEEIANHTDFSQETPVNWNGTIITPDEGRNVLDKVKSDYLWDFSQEPPYGHKLYAVWSEKVTVTFDIVYDGTKLHKWEGPDTTDPNTTADEPYVFYRTAESQYITYTMAKGERAQKPANPDPHPDHLNWLFVKWFVYDNKTKDFPKTAKDPTKDLDKEDIQDYIFDFSKPVSSDKHLITSWTGFKPQYFYFTVVFLHSDFYNQNYFKNFEDVM